MKRRKIRESIAYKILETNHLRKEDLVQIFIMENFKIDTSRRELLSSRQRKKLEEKHGYQEKKEQLLHWRTEVILEKEETKLLNIRQSKREAATKTNSDEADR